MEEVLNIYFQNVRYMHLRYCWCVETIVLVYRLKPRTRLNDETALAV